MIPNRFWAQAKGPLSTLYPYRSFIHLDTTVLSDVAHAWGSLCDPAGVGRSKTKQICQGWQDESTWSTWIANHPHHIMQYFGVIPLSNSEKWRIHRDPGIQNNSKHDRCHITERGVPASFVSPNQTPRSHGLCFEFSSRCGFDILWLWFDMLLCSTKWTKHHVQTMECKKTGPPTPRIAKACNNHQQSGSSRWFLPKPSRCWLQNWSLRVCCWLGRLLRPVPMMWQSFCRCHGVMEVRAWPLVWRLLVLYDTIDVRNLTPSCRILL